MSNFDVFADDEMVLGGNQVHSPARRLYVASMIAALVTAVGFGAVSMVSASHGQTQRIAHRFTLVQQPIFVEQGAVASKQSATELP
jgi:hypothetical protein